MKLLTSILAAMITFMIGVHAAAQISDADKDRAAELVFQGDELRTAGDQAGALEKYQAADEIMGVPTTGLEVAKTLMALGRLKEAQQKAKQVAEFPVKRDEPGAFTRARADASKMQVDLLERIPKVRILIKGGDDAEVTVDGQRAEVDRTLSFDPGEHIFTAKSGDRADQNKITLEEGDDITVELVLEEGKTVDPVPVTPTPVTPQGDEWEMPIIAWVGFGVGAAGLVAGGVVGGIALSESSFLEGECNSDKVCPNDAQDTIDNAVVLSHVSTVMFAVGGAGVALGVIVLAVSLATHEPAETASATAITIEPVVGPGFLGVRGSF